MKRTYPISIFAFLLLITTLCTIPVSAEGSRASSYISNYSLDVIHIGSGKLAIEFSVEGTKQMSSIGAESIFIYMQDGNQWVLQKTFGVNSSGMCGYNTGKYSNTIYYNGNIHKNYKIIITIFAELSGSDSRSKTFYIET